MVRKLTILIFYLLPLVFATDCYQFGTGSTYLKSSTNGGISTLGTTPASSIQFTIAPDSSKFTIQNISTLLYLGSSASDYFVHNSLAQSSNIYFQWRIMLVSNDVFFFYQNWVGVISNAVWCLNYTPNASD